MKFRGAITNPHRLQLFLRSAQMISKVSKLVDLRLTQTGIDLIVVEAINKGGLQMKISIEKDELFSDYIMSGYSEERDVIHLEVPIGILLEVLKHASHATAFKIRLSKKNTPVLVAVAELPSVVSAQRFVSHDIPVRVIPVADWLKVYERDNMDAKIRTFQVQEIKTFLDRIKTISNSCLFQAVRNEDGEMELKALADIPQQIEVEARFSEVQYPAECGSAEVEIDIRKISSILSGLQTFPTSIEIHLANKDFAHVVLDFEDMKTLLVAPSIIR